MTDKSRDPEVALRTVLSSRAAQAPDAGPVVDRIRRARVSADARRRERRTFRGVLDLWAKPLITALVVAALGAGAYGITRAGGGSANSASTSSGAGGAAMKAPAEGSVAAGAASVGGTSAAATATASDVPNGFTATDLTFVSTHEGWAVGSAPCSAGYCVVVLRTTDGGTQWTAVGVPKLTSGTRNIAAAQHIRFADPEHGYLFGSRVYATNDGGAHWTDETPSGQKLLAGVEFQIEVADGETTAVVWEPGASVTVLRSTVGSHVWAKVVELGPASGLMSTSRTGPVMAVLLEQINNGGGPGVSQLWVSEDDGATWANRGHVCPGTGADMVAVGTDSSISVGCAAGAGSGSAPRIATSTDGGRTFTSRTVPTRCSLLASSTEATLFCVTSGGVLKPTCDGTVGCPSTASGTWSATSIRDPGLANGVPSFFGFETASTGRYLSTDGRTVWTTTDAGVHWKAAGFR